MIIYLKINKFWLRDWNRKKRSKREKKIEKSKALIIIRKLKSRKLRVIKTIIYLKI